MIKCMMSCLPNRTTNPLTTQFPWRLRSDPVKNSPPESLGNAVDEMIGTVESLQWRQENYVATLLPLPTQPCNRQGD